MRVGDLCLSLGLAASLVGVANARESYPVDVQALIGVARWSGQSTTLDSTGGTVSSSASDAPVIGIAGQMPLAGELNAFGFEAGATLSWWSQRTSWYASGGQATVNLDVSMRMTDIFAGLYVSTEAFKKIRIYGGAGPAFVMGWNDDSPSYVTGPDGEIIPMSTSSYDSSLGYYGRAGLEFQMNDGAYFGVGFRALDASLDYGGALGKMDVTGYQGLITYTQRL